MNNFNNGPAKSVAFIITHSIKDGAEQRYEDWLANILQAGRHTA